MIGAVPLDPIAKFRRIYAAAARAGAPLHDAMALATADRRGTPSVRYVLLKGADADGFVFFTHGESRKGRELARRPRAAIAFYWDVIGKQVRVEGRVRRLTAAEADAYWATRPRESQLSGAVSQQSAPMPSHRWLVERWRRLRRQVSGQDVPRPKEWGGYCVVPDAIEFWHRGPHRLHRRERYVRTASRWRHELLQP